MRVSLFPWLMAIAITLAGPGRAGEPVVAYTITNGSEITDSLTGTPGDVTRGRALYEAEARAGCPACHGVPGVVNEAATPDLSGPGLSGIGGRMNAGAIRLWIIAPGAIAEDATMPAFYAPGQRDGADDPLYGGPALTATEVEVTAVAAGDDLRRLE